MENENTKIKIAILDSLADDFEGFSQIESYLSYLGLIVSRNDITYMLKSLVDEELIYVNHEISDDKFLWYGMTEKGREVWENSEVDFNEETQGSILCIDKS